MVILADSLGLPTGCWVFLGIGGFLVVCGLIVQSNSERMDYGWRGVRPRTAWHAGPASKSLGVIVLLACALYALSKCGSS